MGREIQFTQMHNLPLYFTIILFILGLNWLWKQLLAHPLWLRRQKLKNSQAVFRSQVDEVPSAWSLARRHFLWLLISISWFGIFITTSTQPGGNHMLFLGLLAFLIGLAMIAMDLLAQPKRALEVHPKGLSYLEEDFDFIPWEEIVLILDYQQAIIIKTTEDIYEFTFEQDPEDYEGLLTAIKEIEHSQGFVFPYHQVDVADIGKNG